MLAKLCDHGTKKIEQEDINHQTRYTENFWKYGKNTFESQGHVIKPGFSKDTCYKYFLKSLSKSSRRDFTTPP